MSLQSAINRNIQARDAAMSRVLNKLKTKSPTLYDRFAPMFIKNVTQQLGADSSWLDYGKDLAELVTNVKANQKLDDSTRKTMELELKKIEASNTALQKQIKLQKQLQQAGTINASTSGAASAIFDAFKSSPLALASIAGLIGTFIFMRKKRR